LSEERVAEVAEGGSVFLDEVGSLSLNIAGQAATCSSGARIRPRRRTRRSSSTSAFWPYEQGLAEAVREDAFRTDLFHRLNVISFTYLLCANTPTTSALGRVFRPRYAKRCNRDVEGFRGARRLPRSIRLARQHPRIGKCDGARRGHRSSSLFFQRIYRETLLEGSPTSTAVSGRINDAIRNLKKTANPQRL